MTESKNELNKDRLTRVRGTTTPKRNSKQLKRKLSPQNSSPQSKKQKQMDLHVFEEIRIGDWCFFRQQGISPDNESVHDNIVIGAISGFKYIEGKSEKNKQYSLDFAPVKAPDNGANVNRGVNVG